jgi:parvulin-like peptidyl-prolyl isomerase
LAKKKTADKPQRQLTRRQLSQHQKQRRRQRFIFIGGITVVAAIVILIFVGWLTSSYLPLRKTVITVDKYKYDMQYYIDTIEFYSKMTGQTSISTVANSAITQIENNALLMLGAEALGISVEDAEARELLETSGMEINDATLDFIKTQLLYEKVRNEYFAAQVPVSASQVNIRVMLLESESQAEEIRERLLASDNFTGLAEEYSLDVSTREDKGEVGWHPKDVLTDKAMLDLSVPGDYAFEAAAGSLSQPLYDENEEKQVGYWLVNVLERPTEEGANIKVILLGSEDEANYVRSQIETTDNLTALIEEYSQDTTSKDSGGLITAVMRGQMNDVVDSYIFDEDPEMGVWSEPLRDDTVSTTGGYWLVEVIDRDDDREISEEDKEMLTSKLYNDWYSGLQEQYAEVVDHSYLSFDDVQWAIEKAQKDLEDAGE